MEGIVIFNDAKENIVGVDSDGLKDSQEGNLISGNNRNGIRILSSQNNIVAGNVIGLAANGSASLANKEAGVLIDYNNSNAFSNSSGNLIGSNGDGQSDELERNWIGGNLLSGVRIDQSTQNQVSGNTIYSAICAAICATHVLSSKRATHVLHTHVLHTFCNFWLA